MIFLWQRDIPFDQNRASLLIIFPEMILTHKMPSCTGYMYAGAQLSVSFSAFVSSKESLDS
jgi:hypothetical protein